VLAECLSAVVPAYTGCQRCQADSRAVLLSGMGLPRDFSPVSGRGEHAQSPSCDSLCHNLTGALAAVVPLAAVGCPGFSVAPILRESMPLTRADVRIGA